MNSTQPVISCDTLPTGTFPVEQAQAKILAAVTPLAEMETIELLQAVGRILAEPVHAQTLVPPYMYHKVITDLA